MDLFYRCVHGECVGGQCHCSHGYSGLSCDERDCDGLVCLNDAYCHLGQCICPEGVYGMLARPNIGILRAGICYPCRVNIGCYSAVKLVYGVT